MKKLLIFGATLLALSSCKSGWSTAEKDALVTKCTSSLTGSMDAAKAKTTCGCIADKAEKKYPKAADVDKITDAEMQEMAKECVK